MHFQYKVKNPAKLKDAYKFLRKSNFIGIYELKTASETIIGGFGEEITPLPSYLQLLLAEPEKINWDLEWEEKIIEVPVAEKKFLLKAGAGFGDASHPTTILCLKAIEELTPKAILDIGSGSGVLSIAAYSLGIKNIVSIEIDDEAIAHHTENLALNKIETSNIKKYLEKSDLLADDQLVMINMILSEQKEVFSSLPQLLEAKKIWYVSGLLKEQLEENKSFYKSLGFEILRIDSLEKWVGLLMKKG